MDNFWERKDLKKKHIDIIQINLGNLCNLSCKHCHIEASPNGIKNMKSDTAEKIINKLLSIDIEAVEFTGGEPILNENLQTFIKRLSDTKEIGVRTNLVSLDISENRHYLDLFKKYNVKITGSLPSPFEGATDSQRGGGVFKRSIEVLHELNNLDIDVDLVYNPTDNYIPEKISKLEEKYRSVLKDDYNIEFNDFINMINVPIKRYKKYLEKSGSLSNYTKELKDKYNPATLDKIMCRSLISIDNEGYIYDCDFNLAKGIRIKGYENKKFWEINFDFFSPDILFDEHCYACTVNFGSSCYGKLLDESTSTGVKENVQNYYGNILSSSDDLKTNACCTIESIPDYVKESLKYINDESIIKYYGCGSPIPLALDGLKVMDVGCGTGRDVFVLSRLIGEKGFSYGIDMTENQINVGIRHSKEQMKIFGYRKLNVEFINDYIENIKNYFSDESLDLIISNCVLNLVEDKKNVLKQIFSTLKFGGELYFSDVYADRRVPDEIAKDEVLYGECLGGALYYKDFERIAKSSGFSDPRIMSNSPIVIDDPNIKELVENINYYSVTYRLWKLDNLEDACEDYGHIAIYKGGVPYSPFKLVLDKEHVFYKNKPERVCGNTALMIQKTRFGKYFDIIGDFSEHFGLFEDCGTSSQNKQDDGENSGGCC